MSKNIVFTENAPAPIGPYNQAVWAGNMLFVSGQIAINPETGEMEDETIESETRQVMENLRAILEEADLSFDNVVKASIFLENMDDFNRVNGIYGQYFDDDNAPARETVEVSRLPKEVNIEISVIAIDND
jgi:2-iminobutanoate/2-iminopropanoate deaminase